MVLFCYPAVGTHYQLRHVVVIIVHNLHTYRFDYSTELVLVQKLIFVFFCLVFRKGQGGRFASEPAGGLTSLTTPPYGPGFKVRSDL